MSDWIDNLARLAEAATPGPWVVDAEDCGWASPDAPMVATEWVGGGRTHIVGSPARPHGRPLPENAEFIAAANPATILRLIEGNRNLRHTTEATIGWGGPRPKGILDDPAETTTEDEACGDYPAPCNCDDPETHDGAVTATGRPSVPRVGDTLTTAEQLDALPDKAVVLDEHEEPWQKLGEGLWCGRADGPMSGSALLRTRTDEVTVLYVPGEQPGRSTDQALAEAWDEGHRTGWEHCQDGNYGNDHWDDPTPNPYAAAGRAETTTEEWPRCKASRDGDCDRCHDEHGRHIHCRAETTTATDEDAARVLDDVIQHLRKIWSTGHDEAREVIDTAEELLAQALPHLATARTRPTRDDLARAIASGYEPDHPTPNRHDYRAADAVLALLRGGA